MGEALLSAEAWRSLVGLDSASPAASAGESVEGLP